MSTLTFVFCDFVVFPPGRIVATPGALDMLERYGQSPGTFLHRHLSGDWGELCSEDVEQNTMALKNEWRIFSSYPLGSSGEKLWVITEADRSVTTLLLPSEY